MTRHVVAIAGIHGRTPDFCRAFGSHAAAVEELALLHDLMADRQRQLREDRFLRLSLEHDGNEYCEILECDCQPDGSTPLADRQTKQCQCDDPPLEINKAAVDWNVDAIVMVTRSR